MQILLKTKIYFFIPLKCKINSKNCQSYYIDLRSISKMRKPFSPILSYPQKKVTFMASSTTSLQTMDDISYSSHLLKVLASFFLVSFRTFVYA